MIDKPASVLLPAALSAALLLFSSGCEQEPQQTGPRENAAEPAQSAPEPTPPAFANYTERGDLPAIHERGILRLLAPRGPVNDALPRDGLPSSEWRQLAEKFAHSRGLEPQWVYVDNFAGMMPALVEGRGDVIATNFSRTDKRAEQVAFTRALRYVRELLVTRRDRNGDTAGPLQVAVRRGSAFAQTLSADERQQRFAIEYLDEAIGHDQLLAGVAGGKYPATVIDSNLADALLPAYPDLAASGELKSQRAIAWAVRRDASQLESALNEFFTAEHLLATEHRQRPRRDWEAIRESRTLRVLTRNHPASYFMWRGELMGFDYDLLKKFASDNNLRLSMVVPGPDVDLAEALNAGMGDLVAASLTVTDARRKQGMTFTRPYLQVNEQVIAAKKSADGESDRPTAELLAGKQVMVNPLSSFHAHLQAVASDQSDPMEIVPVEGATTEQLIDAVARGEYAHTVADSHLVAIESTYRDDFAVIGELPEKQDIAWAVRPDQPQLLEKLNGFLNQHYRGLFFNVTYNKYFREPKRIRRYQQERLRTVDRLSPYDPIVRRIADRADRDWRMIIAQMYQESRFNPKAKSFAGARGLMQVLPRTARQMGVSNLFEPENGIRAGISYLGWLEDRFPRDLPFDQRIYFTLAAYNAGHGHVRDARNLAARLGRNPDLWFGNVEIAMLMLSQPEHYRKARFGYVRGREPVNYVREIRERYLGYLSVARNEKGGE
ncbi:transporter substrate-binding domain-containing protein [Microbulbifer halophilus]|uniref:Transporter substrate-binding domain-containing protein n=1 Tax=Microbulbifer halophilus TaxID=453963 RepID=A0ABW5EGJ8_9GAMM|nr:transporter substrate-binding domain-containing protein [Microbulbifer halophilus]MCW8127368.1 transporter substrate-binding domain-containing protein [Microbulbifer halophilus]